MSNFSGFQNENTEPIRYAVSVPRQKAYKLARRMKAVAIIDIILGVFNCFSTIIAGIFIILAGIKLKAAAEKLLMLCYGAPSFVSDTLGDDIIDYYKKYSIGLIVMFVSLILQLVISLASSASTGAAWGLW